MKDLILSYGVANVFPCGSRAFKQLQIQDILTIPSQKPDVEQVVSVSVNVEITKTYVINTASGRSWEGQIITGRKLVVEGKIHQKLEYVAELPAQPIHAAHFCMPFSTFIVLGKEIECYTEFEVHGYIEDIFVKKIDNRRIFKNILFLLNAVPLAKF